METIIMTLTEFSNLIYAGKSLPKCEYSDSLKNINYFSYEDLRVLHFNQKYNETLRFVVCYDLKNIYGIIKFAYFQNNKAHSISYCSTNSNFAQKGICKSLIDSLTDYFLIAHSGEKLATSEYTVKGWKYLRPLLINSCLLKSIPFVDNVVGYMTDGDDKKEFGELCDYSRKLINKQ